MRVNLHHQPTGNSCGPTCLYMAFEAVVNWPNDLPFIVPVKHTIKDISEMCGTDWEVGTPPEKMVKGMKALNLNYVEYMCSPRPYELLRQVIADGNIPILRTITKGVPHWIVIDSCSPMLYNVLDPWLGKVQYYQPELDEIWKVRQYQFFEILKPTLSKYGKQNVTGNYLTTRINED